MLSKIANSSQLVRRSLKVVRIAGHAKYRLEERCWHPQKTAYFVQFKFKKYLSRVRVQRKPLDKFTQAAVVFSIIGAAARELITIDQCPLKFVRILNPTAKILHLLPRKRRQIRCLKGAHTSSRRWLLRVENAQCKPYC